LRGGLDDIRLFYVGFNLVKGIGAVRLRMLLDAFGDAQTAWNASSDELLQAGLPPKIVQSLVKIRSQVVLDEVWRKLETSKINVLTWEDTQYPVRLLEIDQPPPVIYYKGTLFPEDDWAVGVVGTRRVTVYGKQVAEEISSYLAANGMTIISGLARGVDAIAHQAAIRSGGRTIAVLGCGVDQVYPPEHKRLTEEIIENGAVLSDYPPGTRPEGQNFPPRNRIISGLARAVIVVEASEKSGALITAAFAVEQGREVFAVPGKINAPQSRGTNLLIQQGARIIIDPKEVLEVLNMTQLNEHRAVRTVFPSDPIEASLFSVLSNEPRHIDEIRQVSGLPIEQVSSVLTIMELKGLVKQVGGMQFVIRDPSATYE
jgi:DNA processing protein